jgi:hypothetical protein
MHRHIYLLLMSIIACGLIVSPVSGKLSATGAIFESKTSPGEHFSHNLTMSLSSDAKAPENLTVGLFDWYQDYNGGNIGVKDNPDIAPYSAKNILSINPSNFSLRPGNSQKISIEGDMPAGDGGRYAMVGVKTVPNSTKEGGKSILISVGIYAPVILTINGSKMIRTGEIDNVSLLGPISSKMQNVSMMFKNTGNYHYPVNASATLLDEKGSILAAASTAARGSLIPTATRMIKFSIVPESALKPGSYTAVVNVTLKDGTLLATKKTQFEIKQ